MHDRTRPLFKSQNTWLVICFIYPVTAICLTPIKTTKQNHRTKILEPYTYFHYINQWRFRVNTTIWHMKKSPNVLKIQNSIKKVLLHILFKAFPLAAVSAHLSPYYRYQRPAHSHILMWSFCNVIIFVTSSIGKSVSSFTFLLNNEKSNGFESQNSKRAKVIRSSLFSLILISVFTMWRALDLCYQLPK